MKKNATIALLLLLCTTIVSAQTPVTLIADTTNSKDAATEQPKNGFFFITPFYQFTKFTELELTSHTNKYKLAEGESTFEFPSEDIDEYNNNFDTKYQNSMNGLRIGYQMNNGFGISAYVGLDHYQLKSWMSYDNAQQVSSDLPAITIGTILNYQRVIYDKLTVMAMFEYNFSKSNSENVVNNTSHEISSSYFHSMYWDLNLVLGYRIGSFVPYAGIGFTELYAKTIQEEQFITTNEDGIEFLEKTEFDSNFKGSAFYGFAGIEYLINQNLSIYLRSSFINPVRASIGFRIMI